MTPDRKVVVVKKLERRDGIDFIGSPVVDATLVSALEREHERARKDAADAIRRLIEAGENLLPNYGEDPCGCRSLAQDGGRCPWHVAVRIARAYLAERDAALDKREGKGGGEKSMGRSKRSTSKKR